MFRDILFLAVKDVRFMLKERETLIWVFIMPIVFFFFIGTVTSGFSGGGSEKDYLALKTDDNPGFLSIFKNRCCKADNGFMNNFTSPIFHIMIQRRSSPD